MGKKIDFSKTGGFPMTQDRLDFLQTAWNELALAIAAMGGGTVANKPVIISGAVYNGLSVTDGWVIYNNELLHVPAQTVGAPAGGYSWYGVITRTTGTLTYNSGTTHNVINEATIVVTAVATGTPDDATQFYMGNLIPFGLNAGNADRPNGWTHIAVSTSAGSGGVTGDIYCMKDYRANTLHIRGILGANNAQNFDASPYGAFYTACNLIADFRPASADALFIAQYTLSTEILDNTGVGYIKQINCVLKTGGDLNINWIKPDVSVSSYNIAFNVILGLD